MAVRRLRKEMQLLKKKMESSEVVGFKVLENEKNQLIWDVTLEGPEDSPYAEGQYNAQIEFPSDYPFRAPVVKFTTKVWNPSISDKGEICLEILTRWKPVIYVADVLVALRTLLQFPTADGAINHEAAEQLKNDKTKFDSTVEDWKRQFAM